MSRTDTDSALTTEERSRFARRVVALARELGIHSVSVQYRERAFSPVSGQHTIAWSEGRHGTTGDITLSYVDTLRIPEAGDE